MSENIKGVVYGIIEGSAKTMLGDIPICNLLLNVWETVKSNCAQERLSNWKSLIEDRLTKVEMTLEEIGNNEKFTSAIYQATEMAIKTAENKKREYLANAVLNSLTCSQEESIIMIFFSLIDKYTLLHLKILDFFQNPKKFSETNNVNYNMGVSIRKFIYEAYPEFCQSDDLVNKIVNDLYTDGLMQINSQNLNSMMTVKGALVSRTTELGNQFIDFIIEH